MMPLLLVGEDPGSEPGAGAGRPRSGRAGEPLGGIARRSFRAERRNASRWRGRWWARPELVLADEPSGNLDSVSARALHELVSSLAVSGIKRSSW